ncbi:MAG: energy-coupling factor transporter ATPase [Acidobacteriota bacterium]|nr:energy-coupling factor transporter ATPase [Acidobacteriota bacterium]
MARPLLSLSRVTLRYEHGITALDNVTLDVAEGERVCVLGPNGSGKSTLASVLCGLLAPDEGTVRLVGELVLGPNGIDFGAYRRARRQLGLVFQNPDDQIVTSIVEEDVAFGPENLGVPSPEIGERVRRELRRVALDRYAKADPNNLSGGQRQRVAIAGALAMEPRVLVLDEPGALLDVRGRRGVMRVMGELHASGTTIVHVTHFMEEALAADRVVVMSKGRLVLQGTPQEVFAHGDELSALGLEEPFVARLAEALRARGVDVPWTCDEGTLLDALTRLARGPGATGTGERGEEESLPPSGGSARPGGQGGRSRGHRTGEQGRPRAARTRAHAPGVAAPGPCAVVARSLGYSYGDADAREACHPALAGVSFSMAEGSLTAIVGQTGSGKSTLLRLLCALERPDAGTLLVDGIDTADRRRRRLLHGRVGYVMQHPERQLFAETVWEDVAYGPRNLRLDAGEVERRCHDALGLVGLGGREDASPFHLSGGQQRLCALAGILAMEPRILVLDEPTAGLDPHGRTQLRDIIDRVHAQGTTVIQVTHSMDDAAAAEQVIVLDGGEVLMQGRPCEVFSPHSAGTLRDSGLGLPDALAWALRLTEAGVAGLGQPFSIDDLAARIAHVAAHGPGEVGGHGL